MTTSTSRHRFLFALAVALATGASACAADLKRLRASFERKPSISVEYKGGYARRSVYLAVGSGEELNVFASGNETLPDDLASVAQSVADVIRAEWPNEKVTVGPGSADVRCTVTGTALYEAHERGTVDVIGTGMVVNNYVKLEITCADAAGHSLGSSVQIAEARSKKEQAFARDWPGLLRLLPPADLRAPLEADLARGTRVWIQRIKEAK
jgi:hypothetical protein